MKRLSDWLTFSKQEKASLAEFCFLAVMVTIFLTLAALVVIYAFRAGTIQFDCIGLICH